MADESVFTYQLNIRKRSADGKVQLMNVRHSGSFRVNVAGNKGPAPGAYDVPLTGLFVDLAELTAPGWCVFKHNGLTSGEDPGDDPSIYYVDYGIEDLISGRKLILGELQPGWEIPIYLSRNLLEAYNQTGTGTGPANNRLWLISHIAACNVSIEAYER
jgi:hypothetical protein